MKLTDLMEENDGMEGWISTAEAAKILGVDDSRMRQLKAEGKLLTKKIGRDNFFKIKDVQGYKTTGNHQAGRPEGS